MAMVGYSTYWCPEDDVEDDGGEQAIGSDAQIHGATGARVSGDKEYVIAKIAEFATAQKGDASTASLKALLLDYDSGGKGCLNKDDLIRLLNDAGVCVKKMGFCAPQGMVASGIIDALDTTGDRCVSWDEYKAASGIVEEEAPPAAPSEEGFIPISAAYAVPPVYRVSPEAISRFKSMEAQGALAVAQKPKTSSTSAFAGLALLLAIPAGIFFLASRTAKKPPEVPTP